MQRLYWALLCTNSIEGEMSDSQSLMFVLYIVFLHANQFGWSGFPWMTVLSVLSFHFKRLRKTPIHTK